jgi:chemotaxis protein methyltransferase CheR
MSPQLFSILSALVNERAGLHFDLHHAPVFDEKVAARAAEAGFDSLLDYYYFLRYDAASASEMEALVDALVVNETYLFREFAPLEVMITALVLPALGEGRRPRIWSAACSTGEEPHTVAMLLEAHGILDRVDLVASDVSGQALARARAGRFSRRAVRQDVPPFAAPWLKLEPREVVIERRFTDAIDWRRINLLDEATIATLGLFDVVLCRNVLIYFNDTTVRKVVNSLAGRLRPGGALFVGIAESLLRFATPLACEEQGGVFLYRRIT